MAYEDEFNRLQNIIVSDDLEVSDEQRDVAREARKRLTEQSIGEAIERIRSRTSEYDALVTRLQGVVDKIEANQLSGGLAEIDGILTDVVTAAEGA